MGYDPFGKAIEKVLRENTELRKQFPVLEARVTQMRVDEIVEFENLRLDLIFQHGKKD